MSREEYVILKRTENGFNVVDEYVPSEAHYVYGVARTKRALVFLSKQSALNHIKSIGDGEFHVFRYDGSVDIIKTTSVEVLFKKSDGITTTHDSSEWTGRE